MCFPKYFHLQYSWYSINQHKSNFPSKFTCLKTSHNKQKHKQKTACFQISEWFIAKKKDTKWLSVIRTERSLDLQNYSQFFLKVESW